MINLRPFTLPTPLGKLVSRLPQLPPTLALVTALNLALDRVIPRASLEPLTGKRLALRVLDAGLHLRLTLTPRGFLPSLDPAAADVTISANAYDFLVLALRQEDPDTLFFSRRLLMEGDTELGLLVKNTLDAVDFSALSPVRHLEQLRAGLLRGR